MIINNGCLIISSQNSWKFNDRLSWAFWASSKHRWGQDLDTVWSQSFPNHYAISPPRKTWTPTEPASSAPIDQQGNRRYRTRSLLATFAMACYLPVPGIPPFPLSIQRLAPLIYTKYLLLARCCARPQGHRQAYTLGAHDLVRKEKDIFKFNRLQLSQGPWPDCSCMEWD